MNLPNKLTMLRMFLIPVFMLFFYVDTIPYNMMLALIIFVVASVTDWVDGYIARKYNLITDFGKFMDPVADKLLTMSAMIAFIDVIGIPSWAITIILGREFIVTAMRIIAAEKGIVIAADKLGKIKTVVQMLWIIYVLLVCAIAPYFSVTGSDIDIGSTLLGYGNIGLWASVILTVVSGCNYIIRNKKVFLDT